MRGGSGRSRVALPFRQVAIVTSLAVCALVVLSFVRLAITEYQLSLQEQALAQSVDKLKGENQQLKANIDYLQTDAAIEKLAREELGWTKPGDTAVIVLTSQPAPTLPKLSSSSSTTPTPPTWKQWWDVFFASSTGAFTAP